MTVDTVVSRALNTSVTPCDWCYAESPATYKITDPHSLNGVAYACHAHGTEWFPEAFPPVSLTKVTDRTPVTESDKIKRRAAKRQSTPWYPLSSHRDGLRQNDLVTLHSAFWIECHENGRLHPCHSNGHTVGVTPHHHL